MTDIDRTDWLLVAAVFAAGLLAAGQFAKIAFALPQIAGIYGRDVPRMAYLVSILGIVGILGGVVAGGFVAALGAKRVLIGALLSSAIVSSAQALLPPLPAMTILRVIEGIPHLGVVVAAPPIMAGAATARDRPMVMSLWAAFFGVAFALAAVVMPPVLTLAGVPGLLLFHAVALLAMAAFLAPRLERQDRAPLSLNPVAAHRRIYTTPRFFAPGGGFVFYTTIFVALVTLLPVALDQPWLAAILPLAGLGGTFAAGPILGRVSPHIVAGGGFVFVVLSAVLLLFGAIWMLVPMFVVMGMIPSASFAMIPYLNDTLPDRAQATGCIAQLGNVGTTTGTPIFALALSLGGLPLLFGTLGCVATMGLVAVVLLRRNVRA